MRRTRWAALLLVVYALGVFTLWLAVAAQRPASDPTGPAHDALLATAQAAARAAVRDYYAPTCTAPDWQLDTSDLDAYTASSAPYRAAFADALGIHPTVPAAFNDVTRERLFVRAGVTYERLTFTGRAGITMWGYLLTPDIPTQVGVVVLHGTGGHPDMTVDLNGDWADGYMQAIGRRFAEVGAVVFAPYIPAQGVYTAEGLSAVYGGISGMDWALQQVFSSVDLLRGMGYRVGVYGISWGGQLAQWSAALDTRISAVVVSGWARDFEQWTACVTLPGFYLYRYTSAPFEWCAFDADRLGYLIAPRPAAYEHGDADPLMFCAGSTDIHTATLARIQAMYTALGQGDNFANLPFEGGHVAHGVEAVPWLIDQLN